jgi:hypothetical protein
MHIALLRKFWNRASMTNLVFLVLYSKRKSRHPLHLELAKSLFSRRYLTEKMLVHLNTSSKSHLVVNEVCKIAFGGEGSWQNVFANFAI